MTNIAIVVLDTVRKDVFDTFFRWLPGMHFENAWSTSHYTVPVHASLFTGRYPSEVGTHAKSETLNCSTPVLAESLKETGYTTRGYLANTLLASRQGFNRGFDSFVNDIRQYELVTALNNWDGKPGTLPTLHDWRSSRIAADSPLGQLRHGLLESFRDPSISVFNSLRVGVALKRAQFSGSETESINAILRRCDFGENEFLYLNLMDAHWPYNPPEEYKNNDTGPSELETKSIRRTDVNFEIVRSLYRSSVSYLSDLYRETFDILQDDFDYIITLSDHGELLGEHELWRHWVGIYPELVHVPIVVYQGSDERTVNETTVSLLDVHQTIAEVAGIETDSRGRSLLNRQTSREYLIESHGLRTDDVDRVAALNSDQVELLDQHLDGIVIPPSYYGYQSFDGWVDDSNRPNTDPGRRLEDQKAQLESSSNILSQAKKVPSHVQARLEELGYK